MKKNIVKQELLRLSKKARGVLRPSKVVAAARPPNSPLHDCFEWNDSKAAQAYRLWQARELIVSVEICLDDGTSAPAFFSFSNDRTRPGGGYRDMGTILSNVALRNRMLKEAMRDLKVFEQRYFLLKNVVASVQRVRLRFESKKTG